jgi:endonuclease/exonuclease/phosphatase family metal-dependent hydrolase
MLEVRVATYNVRHCEGVDRVVDPRRTAEVVRATGATVVALQELDRNLERTGYVDQPALLQELSGLRVAFWPTLRKGGGEYGIALAAPGDFVTSFEFLHRSDDEEPRGAIVARLDGLSVIATHLSRRRATRTVQVAQLARLAASIEGPKLLLGDLNDVLGRLSAVRAAGLTSDGSTHATLNRSRRQIDHILAGGNAVVTRTWTLESAASDHLPLIGEVERPPPRS